MVPRDNEGGPEPSIPFGHGGSECPGLRTAHLIHIHCTSMLLILYCAQEERRCVAALERFVSFSL